MIFLLGIERKRETVFVLIHRLKQYLFTPVYVHNRHHRICCRDELHTEMDTHL